MTTVIDNRPGLAEDDILAELDARFGPAPTEASAAPVVAPRRVKVYRDNTGYVDRWRREREKLFATVSWCNHTWSATNGKDRKGRPRYRCTTPNGCGTQTVHPPLQNAEGRCGSEPATASKG